MKLKGMAAVPKISDTYPSFHAGQQLITVSSGTLKPKNEHVLAVRIIVAIIYSFWQSLQVAPKRWGYAGPFYVSAKALMLVELNLRLTGRRAEAWVCIVPSRFCRALDCVAELQDTTAIRATCALNLPSTSCHLINLA